MVLMSPRAFKISFHRLSSRPLTLVAKIHLNCLVADIASIDSPRAGPVNIAILLGQTLKLPLSSHLLLLITSIFSMFFPQLLRNHVETTIIRLSDCFCSELQDIPTLFLAFSHWFPVPISPIRGTSEVKGPIAGCHGRSSAPTGCEEKC